MLLSTVLLYYFQQEGRSEKKGVYREERLTRKMVCRFFVDFVEFLINDRVLTLGNNSTQEPFPLSVNLPGTVVSHIEGNVIDVEEDVNVHPCFPRSDVCFAIHYSKQINWGEHYELHETFRIHSKAKPRFQINILCLTCMFLSQRYMHPFHALE